MDEQLSYEPSDDDTVAAIAKANGTHPREVIMDTLAKGDPILILFGNYNGDLEGQREVIEHPKVSLGSQTAELTAVFWLMRAYRPICSATSLVTVNEVQRCPSNLLSTS